MNKNDFMGITIAAIVTIIMIWLSRYDQYIELMGTALGSGLLLFAICAIFGFGISRLFAMFGQDKKPKESDFIFDDVLPEKKK